MHRWAALRPTSVMGSLLSTKADNVANGMIIPQERTTTSLLLRAEHRRIVGNRWRDLTAHRRSGEQCRAALASAQDWRCEN